MTETTLGDSSSSQSTCKRSITFLVDKAHAHVEMGCYIDTAYRKVRDKQVNMQWHLWGKCEGYRNNEYVNWHSNEAVIPE